MKKKLLFLIILFCVSVLNAQNNTNEQPLTNKEVFQQAELVFEGYFLKLVHTYNLSGNLKDEDTYAILTYYVRKVFKGDLSLEGNSIYITQKGAILDYEHSSLLEATEELAIGTPFLLENGIPGITSSSPAIFFFISSDFPDDENSEYSHEKKYKSLGNQLYVYENRAAGLNNLAFQSREELYNYMSQFEGYIVPASVKVPEKQLEK